MDRKVCLVIPARNAAATVQRCLEAATRILEGGELSEIVLVDDGSTDNTAALAEPFPVRCIRSAPRGRSAARNLGWRSTEADIVWFMDVDCVAEEQTLTRLLPAFDDPQVGGVGGSFTLPAGAPLVSNLIHEEIMERHGRMGPRVNFVATGNAAYRRSVLAEVGGFDEGFIRAQDAELAYRVRAAGHALAFAADSLVWHFHEGRLRPYLRAQAQQGYWRWFLHLRHSGHAAGDSYSSLWDNAQPPVAVLLAASWPLMLWPAAGTLAAMGWVVLALLLAILPLPLAGRLIRRTGQLKCLAFAPFSVIRAFARGFGLVWAVFAYVLKRRSLPPTPLANV